MIAGVDEAGRGPLAGPVMAAAVVLEQEQKDELVRAGLTDSKKLSPRRREKLFCQMVEMGVLWKAQAASHSRIDRMNILQASLWAMSRSVKALDGHFTRVIVDGTCLIPGLDHEQEALPRADLNVPEVAAASIFAKVLRDRAMIVMDRVYPGYGFAGHKGYPTKAHFSALQELGPCPIHRRSFNLHC